MSDFDLTTNNNIMNQMAYAYNTIGTMSPVNLMYYPKRSILQMVLGIKLQPILKLDQYYQQQAQQQQQAMGFQTLSYSGTSVGINTIGTMW